MTTIIPGSNNPRRTWRPRLLLTAAAFMVPALPATAVTIAVRPAAESPVELLRPTPGEVLAGGHEAVVAWRALNDLSAAGIEEWEAFLSLDGGRQWPIRITPHLDAELSSFRFQVPRLPSDDVRLMLRFGDERHEVGYVLPLTLRLVIAEDEPVPLLTPAPAFGRGEAAQPQIPGVVLWVDGGREGQQLKLRTATWQPPGLRAANAGRLPQWLVLAPPRTHTPRCAPPIPHAGTARPSGRATTPVGWVLACFPLLLLQCRRDE